MTTAAELHERAIRASLAGEMFRPTPDEWEVLRLITNEEEQEAWRRAGFPDEKPISTVTVDLALVNEAEQRARR